MPPELQVALIGGRYELTGIVLGVGGMGRVVEAHDRLLERTVAIKLLDPRFAEVADTRLRFEHEARAAAALNHPNVVAVYDTGVHDEAPYIVMERLPGRTVADVLMRAPLVERDARRVGIDLLRALACAHDAGLIHRDVKPGNILVAADGTAKVADFGIAKSVGIDLTRTHELFGTPCYIAPELLRGERADPQSDIYAVGVTMYEMLTGTKPFVADTPWATLVAINRGSFRSIVDAAPAIDRSLAAAIERAMTPDRAMRWGSANEMLLALDGGMAAPAVPISTQVFRSDSNTRRLEPSGTTVLMRRASQRRDLWPAWLRSWRLPVLIAATMAVIAVAGALVAGSTDPPRSGSERPPITQPPATTLVPTPTPSPITERDQDDDDERRGKGGRGHGKDKHED